MNLKKILKTREDPGEVRKMYFKKGQSTLEYVIILTAIIAAIIVAATRFIQPRVENSLDSISQKMQAEVDDIQFGN